MTLTGSEEIVTGVFKGFVTQSEYLRLRRIMAKSPRIGEERYLQVIIHSLTHSLRATRAYHGHTTKNKFCTEIRRQMSFCNLEFLDGLVN